MAKKVEQSSGGDETSHEAIKPQKLKDLIAKVASAENTMKNGREHKSTLIANAVETDKLHKGAFAQFMKLRKMDPVQREAFRFHLEVYCEREWGKNNDLLRTTGAEEQSQPSAANDDGSKDLRPRHLRQPNASAEAKPSSASEHVKALADKAEASLNKVGRGPSAAH